MPDQPRRRGARRGRRTQAERSDATRAALLAAGTELFTDQGFFATSAEQVADRAGLTRGALHHHFGGKEGLFRAVLEDRHRSLAAAVADASRGAGEPLFQLRLAAHAYLEACRDPGFRRIALLDAPAVVGWTECRRLEAEHSLGLIVEVIGRALHPTRGVRESAGPDESAGQGRRVEPLAHLVLGALTAGGLSIAGADDAELAARRMQAALDDLLDAMLTGAPLTMPERVRRRL